MRALSSEQRAVCAIVALGALLLYAYGRIMEALPVSQGMMLDAARNLYQGKGLVGNAITPALLPYYKDLHLPTPYSFYPLVPLVTSWLFSLFGMKSWLMLVLPILCYFLAGVALYALGLRLFGPITALLAAAFLLIQPVMLQTTIITSFTDPVMLCLLITSVLCLFRASESERTATPWLLLAGAALGIAQYARFAGIMLYLPMAFLVLSTFSTRRLVRLAVFLAPCLLLQVPMYLLNLKTIGSILFTPTCHLLFLSPSFPGYSALTMLLPTDPAVVVQRYGPDILHKWLSQMWVHYKYLFTMMNPLVLAAALMTFSMRLNKRQAMLRNFTVLLYLCLAVQNSLFIWDNRYLLPVVPFLALLGWEVLRNAISKLPVKGVGRPVAIVVLALLVCIEPADFFYQSAKNRQTRRVSRQAEAELTRFVRAHVGPEAVVMAADVGPIAWDNGNIAIDLPADLDTAARIYRDFVRFDAVILSSSLHLGGLYNYSPEWADLAAGRKTFLDFHPEQETTLTTGERVVILRDRAKR